METIHFVKTEEISEKTDRLFETEKAKLSDLFRHADIQHIGSTSVPGTISKGDLDINIRVPQTDFDVTAEKLKTIYQINQFHNWTASFASFKDDSRDLGVQLTAIGSSDDCFVTQRDYLRAHPEKVAELNQLKEKFEGKSMEEYRKEKDVFFEGLIKE